MLPQLKRPINTIEKLIEVNTREPFICKSLRYEVAKDWTDLPTSVKGGLAYYFDYFKDLGTYTFLGDQIESFYNQKLETLKTSYEQKIANELLHIDAINHLAKGTRSLKELKVQVIDNLLDIFFIQIEFLIKTAFTDSFLENKARSGKAANFGQVTVTRFESEIDSQIEKRLIIFIDMTVNKLLKKHVEESTSIDRKQLNVLQVIEYNTVIQQYLALHVIKSLYALGDKLYTKIVSRHGFATVDASWPNKPLKRKFGLNSDEEVDPKDENADIYAPDTKEDKERRPSPEPVEIVSSFYPAQPNLPITILTQIKNIKELVCFLKHHTQLKLNSLLDAVAQDYPEANARFSLKYYLISYFNNVRLTLVTVNKERRWQNSLTTLFKGSNWLEREIWDLFGIYFDTHPDLRRILTDYGFMGHPLRKDFPVHGFIDVRYCEVAKSVVYIPTKLMAGWKPLDSMFNKALW